MSNANPTGQNRGFTGIGYFGAPPDIGGAAFGASPLNPVPEISASGHVLILKATVALNIGDLLIADASNTKQVTKSTSGGAFVGVCVGSWSSAGQTNFTAGPAAGSFALVQINGVAPVNATAAVTVGQALTFSASTAGFATPASGAANTTLVGLCLVSQATTSTYFAMLIIAGGISATGAAGGGGFAPALLSGATVSYAAPTGSTYLAITMYGGSGGGGSGISTPHNGGNGAVGGLLRAVVLVSGNSPFTVALGAAGSAAGANPADGGAGGNTTFTDQGSVATLTAGGGGGGVHATAGGNGANGSAPSNTAVANATQFPSVDVNSTTLGLLGGAGGVSTGAASAGLAGFILVQPY